MKRIPLFVTALSFLLGGCMAARQLPTDHYYQLPSRNSAAVAAGTCGGRLGVAPPQVDGLLNERAMLTIHSHHPLEIILERHHFWHQTPATLVQHDLLWYLSQHQAAGQLIFYTPDQQVDAVLHSRLLSFARHIDGTGQQVEVRLEFWLTARGRPEPLFRGQYRQQVEADGPGQAEAVAAFGTALTLIYDRLSTDLGGCFLQSSG